MGTPHEHVVVTSEFPLVPITLNYCRHNRADTASASLYGYRRSLSCAFTAAVIDTVFRPCRTLAHAANTIELPLCHCIRTMLHAAHCAGKLAPAESTTGANKSISQKREPHER